MLQLTVPTPPSAASVCEYVVPVTARGSVALVAITTGRTATMVNDFWLVSVPEVVVTVKSYTPSFVGWPLMTPVVDASATPGGSAPPVTAQVIGCIPPVATSLSVYG